MIAVAIVVGVVQVLSSGSGFVCWVIMIELLIFEVRVALVVALVAVALM